MQIAVNLPNDFVNFQSVTDIEKGGLLSAKEKGFVTDVSPLPRQIENSDIHYGVSVSRDCVRSILDTLISGSLKIKHDKVSVKALLFSPFLARFAV